MLSFRLCEVSHNKGLTKLKPVLLKDTISAWLASCFLDKYSVWRLMPLVLPPMLCLLSHKIQFMSICFYVYLLIILLIKCKILLLKYAFSQMRSFGIRRYLARLINTLNSCLAEILLVPDMANVF